MGIEPGPVLALLDHERRHLVSPNFRREVAPGIVRWHSIIEDEIKVKHSEHEPDELEAAVRGEIANAAAHRRSLEWQVYEHDRPSSLPQVSRRHGFAPGPTLALMVFDLATELPPRLTPSGYEIRRIGTDKVSDYESVLRAAWPGTDFCEHREFLRIFLARWPDQTELYVAYTDGVPVACGRALVGGDSSFAALVGGATVPAHRGKGLYTELVRVRARSAKDRGHRYFTVAASDDSRPILGKLGFVIVSHVTSWELPAPNQA